MRKIVLSNIQALDPTFLQDTMGIGGFLGCNGLSLEVNSADECPICHFGIDLSQNSWRNYHDLYSQEQEKFNVFSIHICSHCHHGFVTEHHMVVKTNDNNEDEPDIVEESQAVYPYSASEISIDEQIRKISPRFYDIYRQCLIAKNEGLSDLYGMGFRKALEQLITDFAINKHSAEKDKILAMSLHNRIESYFRDSDAKTALMACKWLGNNETHYENCNTKEDIVLFEELIEDTLYYIHRELRKEKAQSINEAKGKK
jgi:hypothetical protein